MPTSSRVQRSLVLWGAIAGLLALSVYFAAVFLPLPDVVARNLAIAMGPLLSMSFVGVYAAVSTHGDGAPLRFGAALGVAAGVVVNAMIVVQTANNALRDRALAATGTDAELQASELVWRAVNRVQFSLDVSWDVFIATAGILIGIAMLRHTKFGHLFGWPGILLALLLLGFNLYTFPEGPADVGLIDVGPFYALWFVAVFVRMLTILPPREGPGWRLRNRRSKRDRRSGGDRRSTGDRREQKVPIVFPDRRKSGDRRTRSGERRSEGDRRSSEG
jgi:hypothetical protein